MCALAQNEAIEDEDFSNDLTVTGLRTIRMHLGGDSGAAANESGTVVIDNIVTDILEEKLSVPMINTEENATSAYVTLSEDEEEMNLSLFLALYNADGSLFDVSLSSAQEGGALSCTAASAIPVGGSARAFLWDGSLRAKRPVSVK